MQTRAAQFNRMKYLMSKLHDDVWIRIIGFLSLADGRQLLVVNKNLAKIFYENKRYEILKEFVQNIDWCHGYYDGIIFNKIGDFDISITMPTSYLCIFCRMINHDPSLIEEIATDVYVSFKKELSGYGLSSDSRPIQKIDIEVRWNVHEATGSRRKLLSDFKKWKAYQKKFDEILFCNAQKYLQERKGSVKILEVKNIIDPPECYPQIRWSYKKRGRVIKCIDYSRD